LETPCTVEGDPAGAGLEKGNKSSGAEGSSVIEAEEKANAVDIENRMIAISGNRILFMPDDSPTL